jgi:hypothetical protein
MTVSRIDVAMQAQRMLDVLDRDHPGSRSALADDAWAALSAWGDVQLQPVDDTQTDDRCSVAGGYVASTIPPTLTVTRSLSRGRRTFTLLHELGHHLQQNDIDLAVAVRQQTSNIQDFEDAACDAFAARVIISDQQLQALLTERSPTTDTMLGLLATTQASRSAVCARLVDHLGATGIVAVVDRGGRVLFARARGDIAPPARGSDQSSSPLIRQALRSTSTVAVDDTVFTYRTGSISPQLYGQAAWSGDYLMVVAVLDRPGWKSFAPSRDVPHPFQPRLDGWCEICQESFTVVDRCDVCKQGRCPEHGHCACSRKQERTCGRCFLVKHNSQFPSAAGKNCTDCSE